MENSIEKIIFNLHHSRLRILTQVKCLQAELVEMSIVINELTSYASKFDTQEEKRKSNGKANDS